MSGENAVLKVEGLSIATRTQPPGLLVRDVGFEVGRREIVTIVGESGSGKSLTSLAVMGLLPKGAMSIAGGRILLDGEDLTGASERRLRSLRASSMAMVFQEPMTALNPLVPVGRQIDEVLREHTGLGRAARRRRVLEMLEDVRLPEVERMYRSYPHQLSGGQRQRVVIAMALILGPKLLIADEPTTALDVTTQKQVLKLVRDLRDERGTSVVFITHDMGVVAELADRVVVMRDGAVVEQGPVATVLSAPKEPYTRSLLEAVPSLVPRPPRPDGGGRTVLRVDGLGKSYVQRTLLGGRREVHAARGVALSLVAGRTVGIVGESGSGKSTVARCVARLIDPTDGSILVDGEDIARTPAGRLKPVRRRIQVVFQDPNRSLNPRLTVGRSVTEGPTNFGVPYEDALVEARRLLELVGLPGDAVDLYPHQFSGGQRQRIAIARALAVSPDILIADEAVSALDVSVQAQVLRLLDGIQERLGIGILFITHDLRVAAQICDEIIVMHKGEVVEAGPAARVLLDSRSEYTRTLWSSVPGRHWDFAGFRPMPGSAGTDPAAAGLPAGAVA